MDYIYGIILGFVQGITEFLPISSSGHLFVAEFFIQQFGNETLLLSNDSSLFLVILLHVATLFSVLVFTRRIILNILFSSVSYIANLIRRKTQVLEHVACVSLLLKVIFASFMSFPLFILLRSSVENISLLVVTILFFVTAIWLLLPTLLKKSSIDNLINKKHVSIINISFLQALLIGFMQSFAVFPGISRSGITIVTGVLLGLTFIEATYFSFLLSIPAILAGFFSSLIDYTFFTNTIPWAILIVSMVSAFLFGLIGLSLLSVIARKQKLWYFSIYLVLVGILLIFLQ